MTSSFAPHPHPTVRRYSNLARAARPSAMAGAVILCTAILIAALSTVDPLWWHLHFSRLGMFADASGYTFNGGVVLSGLVIAAGGVPLAVHLANAVGAGRVADVRAARMLPPLLVTLGLCLALIGVIPLTLSEFLHDRAANGVLLSFLGLVIVSRRTMPELPSFLGRYALATVAVLAVGIGFMVAGVINLAAFEVLAFGGVLSWVHLLERSVRTIAAEAKAIEVETSADAATLPASEPVASDLSGRHVVRRGARVRVTRIPVRTLRVAHIENELRVPPERDDVADVTHGRRTVSATRRIPDGRPRVLRITDRDDGPRASAHTGRAARADQRGATAAPRRRRR